MSWTPGVWSAICDVCGLRYKSNQLKKRWDGLMVCSDDYETRHPQDFLRVRTERIAPPWTRPEPTDTFLHVCDAWTSSSYADYGTAGCMTVGYTPPFTLLHEEFAISAIANIAIANQSVANLFNPQDDIS